MCCSIILRAQNKHKLACLFICLNSYFRATAVCSLLFCCPVTIAYFAPGYFTYIWCWRIKRWWWWWWWQNKHKRRTDKQIALTATHKTHYTILQKLLRRQLFMSACFDVFFKCSLSENGELQSLSDERILSSIYRVAQNKIPQQTICNFSATSSRF